MKPLLQSASFFVLILIIGLCASTSSKASHYHGSDITLTYTGTPGLYEVRLQAYRDCNPFSINFPTTSITLGGTSACGNVNFQVFLVSVQEASEVCPGQTTECSAPPNLSIPGVEVWTYEGYVSLSNCANWKFSWASGTRNAGIANLAGNTSNHNWYTEATLNTGNGITNSSPRFHSSPVPYVCHLDTVSINPQAYDPDGDSLVFSLIAARSAATTNIPYATGYSAQQPFGTPASVPANPFPATLDPQTGQLTFRAMLQSSYVLVIKVQEFRNINGVPTEVGSVMRDVQVTVVPCTPPYPTLGDQLTVVQGGITTTVPGDQPIPVAGCLPVCISVAGNTTASPGITLTMTSNNANEIPGSTFTISGQNTQNPVGQLCFTPGPADAGKSIHFTVSVQDNACPFYNKVIKAFTLTIGSCNSIQTTVPAMSFCTGDALTVPFTSTATFGSNNTFVAELSDATGSFASPVVIGTLNSSTPGSVMATIPPATPAGTAYRIRVNSTDPAITGTDNGYDLTITGVPSVSALALPDSVAPGQLVTLIVSNPVPGITYIWSGAGLNQTTGDTVTANPTATGTVTYTVTAVIGGCAGTGTTTVEVDASLAIQTSNWLWAISGGGTNGRLQASGHAAAPGFNRQLLTGETGIDIAVHQGGTAITLGRFKGTATFAGFPLTSQGDEDIVLVRTDPAGNVMWVGQAGGPDSEEPRGIAMNLAGGSYICGSFSGTAAFGASTLTASAPEEAFLVSYSSAGTVLWARKAGGVGIAAATGVAVDENGNTTITGYFTGTISFGPGSGTISLTSAGSSDAFVARYNMAGDVQWARRLGGTNQDGGYAVAVDAQGNSYLSGTYKGSASFGTLTLTSPGSDFGKFFCKLDALGNVLWAKATGFATAPANADALAVDQAGYACLAGNFTGSITMGSTTLTSAGSSDIYLANYTSNGDLTWATRAGGAGEDLATGVAVDNQGLWYLTGTYSGHALFGSQPLSSIGGHDVFVAKYDLGGNCLFARKAGGIAADAAAAIAVDAQGNSYVTGSYQSTASFSNHTLVSLGQQDMFVAKLENIQVLGTEDAITAKGNISVFPNPFSSGFSVALSAAVTGRAEVQLLDMLGRRLFGRSYEVAAGEAVLQVQPEQALPQGVYLLQVRMGDTVQTLRVLKQ